jgi:uncharacterized protein (TIRG00374 family)
LDKPPAVRSGRRWEFALGLLVSGVFLYVALSGLRLRDVWGALQSANYLWLIPGVMVYFMGVGVRAWRWQYLLRPVRRVPFRQSFELVSIGYMGNNIFPARLGELLRAVVLKRREGVPISASLATIIVERVFDGVVMLAFVFLNLGALATIQGSSGFIGSIRSLAIWGAVVFVGALSVFLLAAMFPERTRHLIIWFSARLVPERFRESLTGFAFKFLGGIEALRSPHRTLMIFLTSVIIWLFETGKYWFVMHAFDFDVSVFALMLMNGIVNLTTTIPSAPGYIGTFDAPGIAVLEAFGVPKATAAGYTLVLHVALWLPITVLGAYFFIPELKYFRDRGLTWFSSRDDLDTRSEP